MKRISGVVARGAAGGIVGATALALWFLVLDGVAGVPFRTPSFIAHAMFGFDDVRVAAGPILLYTLIHYAAWVLVGVVVAFLRTKVKALTALPILIGLALGFALFDLVFYTSLAVTGVDVVDELGWEIVLSGNMFAGVCLVWFLHLVRPTRTVSRWSAVAENPIVREGVAAGFIGATVVAGWFLVFELGRGCALFTPGALGSAIFLGAQSPEEIQVTAATVIGYTVFHIIAFIVAGFLAAAIVAAAEITPPLVLGAVLFFVIFEAFFMGALTMVAEFLLGTLAWWTIAVGNIVAAISMGWFLWRRHPDLRAALAANPFDQTD